MINNTIVNDLKHYCSPEDFSDTIVGISENDYIVFLRTFGNHPWWYTSPREKNFHFWLVRTNTHTNKTKNPSYNTYGDVPDDFQQEYFPTATTFENVGENKFSFKIVLRPDLLLIIDYLETGNRLARPSDFKKSTERKFFGENKKALKEPREYHILPFKTKNKKQISIELVKQYLSDSGLYSTLGALDRERADITDNFTQLPDELIEIIASKLSRTDYFSLARSCTRFLNILAPDIKIGVVNSASKIWEPVLFTYALILLGVDPRRALRFKCVRYTVLTATLNLLNHFAHVKNEPRVVAISTPSFYIALFSSESEKFKCAVIVRDDYKRSFCMEWMNEHRPKDHRDLFTLTRQPIESIEIFTLCRRFFSQQQK